MTLVEMLTGHPPYHDLEPMAAWWKILNDETPIVLPQRDDIGMHHQELVETLMKRFLCCVLWCNFSFQRQREPPPCR